MSTIKTEDIAVTRYKEQFGTDWTDFLIAVQGLKVGQSFVLEYIPSNYRLALSIAKIWLGKEYPVRKEGKRWRVGCIKKAKK